LPGIVVDLPTLTEKDKEDILGWGVPNDIDMIALSFVRKGSDLVTVRKLLGQHAKRIKLMSKVCLLCYFMVYYVSVFPYQ
jgi:pyruvate kinase